MPFIYTIHVCERIFMWVYVVRLCIQATVQCAMCTVRYRNATEIVASNLFVNVNAIFAMVFHVQQCYALLLDLWWSWFPLNVRFQRSHFMNEIFMICYFFVSFIRPLWILIRGYRVRSNTRPLVDTSL